MKGTFFTAIIVVFSMLAIPLSAIDSNKSEAVAVDKFKSDVPYEKNKSDNEKIKVLLDDKVIEYSINDYIFGVVAGEMPALYEKEAIKAQAVAAYTFTLYKKSTSDNEFDISSDPLTAQCFITRERAKERWGEKAQEYEKKIDECIEAVGGQKLTYNKKPIFAAYHAISSGTTNNCADVWGSELPYLQSVDSSGDCLSEKFLSEVSFTAEELSEKLKEIATNKNNLQNSFSDIVCTQNGYVKEIKYCGQTVQGAKLRELLNLRSANFEIGFENNKYTFTVKGYGHGVGMSQTGADYMAKQGKTYEQILLHYYNGATLEKN